MISNATPFDALFADLSDRMGVLHTVEADPSQRDRVVWERQGSPVAEPCPYQLSAQKVIGRLAHPWTATIHGATDLEVSNRLSEMWGHIDLLVGPPQGSPEAGAGYKIMPGKIELRGGDGTAAGWACEVVVTLRTITVSEIRPLAQGSAQLTTTPRSPEALTGTAVTWPA